MEFNINVTYCKTKNELEAKEGDYSLWIYYTQS